jgi:hypothetical protein
MVALLAGYVYWDVARPLQSNKDALQASVGQRKVAEQASANLQRRSVTELSRHGTKHEGNENPGDVGGAMPGKLATSSTSETRRQEAIRRADLRSETLRNFHATQPRNAWAQEAEIELQKASLPEGIAFKEVSCKADICRVVATGRDRHAIFDVVSGVQKERKTFSRQISESGGIATVESFVSPNSADWPNPFAKEGG